MKHSEKTKLRVYKLKDLLKNKHHLLIVMQNNPDPDSIAAAVALRELTHHLGKKVNCSITYGGTVGRGENRALVLYLDLNLREFEEINLKQYDLIAMVDTQPQAGNNPLPQDVIPDIVIDHHPYRRATSHSKLSDIRSGYGATSTILFEYLREAGIKPDPPLATAIIYAIRSDTQDLGMESTHADIEAIQYLFPIANKRMLSLIQRGQVPREYFQTIVNGLRNAIVYGRCIITSLGDVLIPDMTGEIADLLLRDDEVTWAMCYAYYDGKILISVRTSETDLHADKVMEYIVARRGKGGGHATLGGGHIPLKRKIPSERISIEHLIQKRLLDILKINDNKGCPLLGVED